MNNRHLSRGKRVDNREWVEGFYVEVGLHKLILTGRIVADRDNYLDWERHEVDPDTVGQCADLPDKNGTLIFEGDIIVHNDELGVVEFEDACFHLLIDNIQTQLSEFHDYELEITSNIHDHPEWLERSAE